MDMKYDHIIVDTNNVFHANHYAFNKLTYKVKNAIVQTGGIYGSLLFFNRMREKYLKDNGSIWALFDNAKSKINNRKGIDPSYKANRKKMPKSFYRSLDYFRLILLNHTDGDYAVYETGYEADDIAPVIVQKIPRDKHILIVSEDMDWSRLIDWDDRVIHQYMKKEVFTRKKFCEKYHFTPTEDKIVLYKTIRGDSVDNIPIGVRGLPSKILYRLLDDHKDIFKVYENIKSLDYVSDLWREKIIEAFPRLRLNYQLVSFMNLRDNCTNDYISRCFFQPHYLKAIYESLGFNISKIDPRVSEFFASRIKMLTPETLWKWPIVTGKQ